jgi:hypothetical protein
MRETKITKIGGRGAYFLLTKILLKLVLLSMVAAGTFAAAGNPAQAADFSSSSGLGDIWYVDTLSNGNILAVDSTGKAAVFDYLNWTIINNGLGMTLVYFSVDPSTNCIIATPVGYQYNSITPYKYNIATNTWSQAGPYFTCPKYIPYFFSRNGELFIIENPGHSSNHGTTNIYKLQSNSWVPVSSGSNLMTPTDHKYGNDPYSGKVLMGYSGGTLISHTQYDFLTGSWGSPGYSLNTYRGGFYSTGVFKNVLAHAYSNNSTNYVRVGSTEYNAGATSTGVHPDVFVTKDFLSAKYYAGAYINNGSSTINVNPGYPLNVASYDKFGNMVLGGPNGKVVIRDKSGVIQTDTSFYSELIIYDVRALAQEAAAAAQAAKNNASTAATNAATAATRAQEAKTSADTASARAWDTSTGKSAATLAKEARAEAQAAKSNAATAATNAATAAARALDASIYAQGAANAAMVAYDEALAAKETSEQVLEELNNLRATVGPEIKSVKGYNGATCTRTSSFSVIVEALGATQFRASSDGGTWTGWVPVTGTATVTGLVSGANTIRVEARNAAGATATGQMIAFKI